MVILDGQEVDATLIDPAQHRFLGMFRYPQPVYPTPERPFDVHLCACHLTLWDLGSIFTHWQQGHMDVPQYQTIGLKHENS